MGANLPQSRLQTLRNLWKVYRVLLGVVVRDTVLGGCCYGGEVHGVQLDP